MAVTSMANSSIRDSQKFRNMSTTFGVSPFACEYVVVAGGGGAAVGGGGAGGYRSNVSGENSGGGASAESALSLVSGIYTVTVGAGGASATSGNASVFYFITTVGGGKGGQVNSNNAGAGGSGVVIFSVPKQAQVSFSGGVTSSVASSGVYNVYTVTATSTTSETVTIS